MFRRSFCLAVALALAAASAQAQQVRYRVPGPEGVMLTVGPLGDAPTEASVVALLNEALANFDNSAITVRSGLVRVGEEFASRALPYEAVARLNNDVIRPGATVPLLPAGTPVHRYQFVSGDMLYFNERTIARRMWCGSNGTAGYCVMQRGDAWEAAEVRSYSPYAPMSYGIFVPVNAPEVSDDASAISDLPERRETFRLQRIRGERATIGRTLYIGSQSIEVSDITVEHMLLGSIKIEFERGPERDSATISSAPLNPADYESELYWSARNVLATRR